MIQIVTASRLFFKTLRYALLFVLLALLPASTARGQGSTTDGQTPSGIAPGSPAGSYALSGFDSVNVYNGNLNVSLPLLQIGGRGGAGYTMTLQPKLTKWSVQHDIQYYNGGSAYDYYYPESSWWSREPKRGPGSVVIRHAGRAWDPCPSSYKPTNTRITFTAPDGTEYEFRDQIYGGKLVSGPINGAGCTNGGVSRGQVFVTVDGSTATFVSDNIIYDDETAGSSVEYPSGYLLMRDGTRYRITDGNVTWMRDRNGNQVSFTYDASNRVINITDSLNRQVTVTYSTVSAPYDEITYTGFGGAPRTLRIWYASLSSVLRSGYTFQTPYQLFPELNGSSYTAFNPTVASALELPDGRRYEFRYNSYGEIARIALPTGGAIEYDYAAGKPGSYASGVVESGNEKAVYRRVVERRVYRDGVTLESKSTYGVDGQSGYVVEQLDANNNLLARAVHYFHGSAYSSLFASPISSESVTAGREYQTEVFAVDRTTILRRVAHTWQTGAILASNVGINPHITETVTTIEPAGANLVSRQTFGYSADLHNNLTDAYEYDFGVGAAAAYPTRHTHTDYLGVNPANNVNYAGPANGTAYAPGDMHQRGLPVAQKVYAVNPANGAETLVAQSETRYDESAYPLITYGAVTGWSDPGTIARGSATTVTRWLDTTGGWLETHAQYDQTGNVRKAWDAKGNLSQVEYASTYHYAYPTHTMSAVPDPSNQRATNTSLESWTSYDFSTGKVTATTDANSKTTSYQYNDALNRLTRVDSPDGGWTTHAYGSNFCGSWVGTYSSINAAQSTEGYQFFDGLGRPARSFQLHNNASDWLTVDTLYDGMGRSWRVSNSYYSGGCGSEVNPSGTWTTTAYDALGRVSTVTTPGAAQVTTAYSGNTVTVTDQAGKSRRSVTDALGRLTQVVEGANVGVCQPEGAGCATNYTYDVVGNLRKVDQDGQYRYFMYDSLGRLLRAKNPEQAANANLATAADPVSGNTQWSLSYAYDNNGNLSSRTDARGVTTAHEYDNINRLKQTTYSDGTPYTLRTYDFAANGRGRFYADYESSTAGTINYVTAYDEMGRPTSGQTDFYLAGTGWRPAYTTSRIYDKMGHVTSQTYPSERVVNYSGFDVAGRLKVMAGNLGDSVTRTYATGVNRATGVEEGIQYDEASRMVEEKFGTQTPLYHKRHYNVRGQLYDVRLSTVAWVNDQWNWNRGCLAFYYGSAAWGQSGADNNGNISYQQNWVPDNDQISSYTYFQDNYAYDALNRLSGMEEYRSGAGAQFGQWFTYDRFGNRTINEAATTPGINRTQYTVDTNTNRLGVPGGYGGAMSYDAAGNLTYDSHTPNTLAGSRTYDAEGRMRATYYTNNQLASDYTYDAAGKRVRRKILGSEVWQVYGFDGELLAEYAANGVPSSPQKEYGYRNGELLVTAESNGQVNWLVTDHLGTPRMIADQTGSLANIKRHDYLPFGEELDAGTGGRTTQQGYSQFDGVRQKFTSKERDDETGLDYFLARYYSSAQGRFTSPDDFKGGPRELWVLGSGHPEKQALFYAEVTNPQSLNKYQYCFNNPLRYVDPDGQNPQDSFEIRMQQAIRDVNSGRITPEQYWDRLRGAGVGAAAGLAVLVAARGGAATLTALSMWAGRNTDKVQQIAQGLQEAAGGPPGLTLAPNSSLRAAERIAGERLGIQLGVRLDESAHVGADYIVAGTKTTIDGMGTPDAYKYFGSGKQFFESIVHHVNKSVDYVAIDLNGASRNQTKAIEKFVGGLTEEQRNKIIYVR